MIIVAVKVPLGGSNVDNGSMFINLTVAVLADEIQIKNPPFDGIEPLGTPNAITSFTAAPAIVIVRSVAAPGRVTPKFNVALVVIIGVYPGGLPEVKYHVANTAAKRKQRIIIAFFILLIY